MGLGTVITLGLDFSGPNIGELPKIAYVDSLEGAGSLFLIDVRHPTGAIPSGAPTQGQVLPNLLSAHAAPLLGTSDSGATVQALYTDPGHGKVERSAKGGIHVIQSAQQTGYSVGFQLRLPTALVAYMKTNYDHKFYISQWGKTTRAETASQHSVAAMSGTSANSFAFSLGDSPSAGAGLTQQGYRPVTEVAGAANFRNAGVSDFHLDFRTGTTSPQAAAIFEVGNFLAPNQGPGKAGLHGAQIFYRGYIEDLTVSGRTYSQVDALDYAEYTRQVLTVGGRYYGDTTPTNPASIP